MAILNVHDQFCMLAPQHVANPHHLCLHFRSLARSGRRRGFQRAFRSRQSLWRAEMGILCLLFIVPHHCRDCIGSSPPPPPSPNNPPHACRTLNISWSRLGICGHDVSHQPWTTSRSHPSAFLDSMGVQVPPHLVVLLVPVCREPELGASLASP